MYEYELQDSDGKTVPMPIRRDYDSDLDDSQVMQEYARSHGLRVVMVRYNRDLVTTVADFTGLKRYRKDDEGYRRWVVQGPDGAADFTVYRRSDPPHGIPAEYPG